MLHSNLSRSREPIQHYLSHRQITLPRFFTPHLANYSTLLSRRLHLFGSLKHQFPTRIVRLLVHLTIIVPLLSVLSYPHIFPALVVTISSFVHIR